jgi:hypothetical protein
MNATNRMLRTASSKVNRYGNTPSEPFRLSPRCFVSSSSPKIIPRVNICHLIAIHHSVTCPCTGVSADYDAYQFYNSIQTACIAISGALAFDALLRSMGIGQSASKFLSPMIVWLLKEGAGMIGRIVFTWKFASNLDANCKQWHFIGDILNDVASTLDLLTPHFPSALLLTSSLSNICRSVTMVIHGSTRTVIFQVTKGISNGIGPINEVVASSTTRQRCRYCGEMFQSGNQ